MTNSVALALKMLESLPEHSREKVVEDLRKRVMEEKDELEWEKQIHRKKKGLVSAAQNARRQSKAGRSSPMNFEKL